MSACIIASIVICMFEVLPGDNVPNAMWPYATYDGFVETKAAKSSSTFKS